MQPVSGQFDVGFHHHFAGIQVHHVGCGMRPIQFGSLHFDPVDGRRSNRLQRVRRYLAPGKRDLRTVVHHRVRRLDSHQVRRALAFLDNRPLQLSVGDVHPVHRVERLENFLVRTQPQRAQKDRP